jgi:hypothetical protein
VEIAQQNMINGTCSIEHITRAMLAAGFWMARRLLSKRGFVLNLGII